MNTEAYSKKQMTYAIAFIIAGTTGLLLGLMGFILGIHNEAITGVAIGLACGFTPTGIGMLILNKKSANDQKMTAILEIKNEERTIFINTKSGHTAFWISYWCIFGLAMISSIVSISMQLFSIVMLIIMPLIYFSLVIINHKKY